jgi:hypothetical protein
MQQVRGCQCGGDDVHGWLLLLLLLLPLLLLLLLFIS